MAAFPTLLVLPIFVAYTNSWHVAHEELGLLELIQLGVWCLAVLSAGVVAPRIQNAKAFWSTVFLGVLCVLALMRELDMHILLNPKTLGDWGVRFRWDWWVSLSAPVLPRLMWAAIAGVTFVAVFVPFWKSRGKPDFSKARPRLFVLALVFLFLGFSADHLIRHFMLSETVRFFEEYFELIGSVLVWAAVMGPESADAAVTDAAA